MIAYFFSETGFNTVDIPDSLKLVEENANLVFEKNNINLIQIDNLYKLTIKGMNRKTARSIDYIIIDDNEDKAGYFVSDKAYEFRAPNIVTFFLILDPYATIGGLVNENEIISGTAQRMSVNENEDNTKFFTSMEPFQQNLRPTIAEGILDGRIRDSHENINLLETLVIPPRTLKDVETTTQYDTGRSYKGVSISMPSNATRQFEGAGINQEVIQTEENVGGTQKITSTTVNDVQVFEYREMKQTFLKINGLYGDAKTVKTGSRWWREDQLEGRANINGVIKKTTVINDLRITGSDNNVTNFWSVPAPYIKSSNGTNYAPQENFDYGGIDLIESSVLNSSENWVINANYTRLHLKNNKCKYGQSTTIIVYSPVSGSRLEKDWPSIIDNDCPPSFSLYKASFSIGADIRPSGSPIFKFKFNNGKTGDEDAQLQGFQYSEILKGGPWRQIPISGQGIGNALSQIALNQQKDELNLKSILGIGAGLASIGVGIATGGIGFGALGVGALAGDVATGVVNGLNASGSDAGYVSTAQGLISKGAIGVAGGGLGIAGTIGSYAVGSLKQSQQQELLNKQGNTASAVLKLSTSDFVRELGYNTFYVMYIMYNDEDMLQFDRFLTLYGYNVGNKKITSDDFNSRPGFNYMKINDIDIRSEKGVWLIERVKEQLKAGVRIWHEMPNAARIIGGNKL